MTKQQVRFERFLANSGFRGQARTPQKRFNLSKNHFDPRPEWKGDGQGTGTQIPRPQNASFTDGRASEIGRRAQSVVIIAGQPGSCRTSVLFLSGYFGP